MEQSNKMTMEQPVTAEVTACFLSPMVASGVITACQTGVISYYCGWLALAA